MALMWRSSTVSVTNAIAEPLVRGREQLLLAAEVVDHGLPGDARPRGDRRDRHVVVPVLEERLPCRLEDAIVRDLGGRRAELHAVGPLRFHLCAVQTIWTRLK